MDRLTADSRYATCAAPEADSKIQLEQSVRVDFEEAMIQIASRFGGSGKPMNAT